MNQGAQNALVVITSNAVRTQRAAPLATVNERQLSVAANPKSNGTHGGAAGAGPVPGSQVEVLAVQAVRAVVAVLGSWSGAGDGAAAVNAGEAVVRSRLALVSNARTCHGGVLGRCRAMWPQRDVVVGSCSESMGRMTIETDGGRSTSVLPERGGRACQRVSIVLEDSDLVQHKTSVGANDVASSRGRVNQDTRARTRAR